MDWRATGCSGKVRFDTFTLANRARDRHPRRGSGVEGARQVYHCEHCRGFHIGSQSKRKSQVAPAKFKARHDAEGVE